MILNIPNLFVMSMELLMAMPTVVESLPNTAFLTQARRRSIHGELFQHERAPEMQRHLWNSVSFC